MPSKTLTSPLDRNGDQDQFKFGGGANTITVVDHDAFGYIINSGGGDDNVTGSILADDISGGDGDDTLTGGGGGDVIRGGEAGDTEKVSKNGGPSSNTIYGDFEIVDLRGGLYEGPLVDDVTSPFHGMEGVNGGDTLYGGDHASNTIYGDAWNVLLSDGALFVGSGDTIYGGDGDGVNFTAQYLYGDALVINTISASTFEGGADTVNGGDNTTNSIYGDFQSTTGSGLLTFVGGVDTLTGGDNATNTIYGDGQRFANAGSFEGADDIIFGGANGTNHLYGDLAEFDANGVLGTFTGGNDIIHGGANATDWMYGDYDPTRSDGAPAGGADTFVIGLNGGEDHIMDFRESDGDLVDLSAYGFTGVGDLTWFSDGGALAIDLGGGNTVTFENIAWDGVVPVPLEDDDFIF